MTSVEELEARFYANHVDHHAVFAETVRKYVRPGAVILDAGAGRGERHPYDYGELGAHVVGVDVDPAIAENPNLGAAVIGDLSHVPFRDSTFDLVFSNYVLEPVDEPLPTFRGLRRVMKDGAHLVFARRTVTTTSLSPPWRRRTASTSGSTNGAAGLITTRSPPGIAPMTADGSRRSREALASALRASYRSSRNPSTSSSIRSPIARGSRTSGW